MNNVVLRVEHPVVSILHVNRTTLLTEDPNQHTGNGKKEKGSYALASFLSCSFCFLSQLASMQGIYKESYTFKQICQKCAILKCNFSLQTEGPSVSFVKEASRMLSAYKTCLRARCKNHCILVARYLRSAIYLIS